MSHTAVCPRRCVGFVPGLLACACTFAVGQVPSHQSMRDALTAQTPPEAVARLFWGTITVKCTRSKSPTPSRFYFEFEDNGRCAIRSQNGLINGPCTAKLWEYQGDDTGISTRLVEAELSAADKANGFQWRGTSYLLPTISRVIRLSETPQSPPDFVDGGGLVVRMEKRNGVWTFGLVNLSGHYEPPAPIITFAPKVDPDEIAGNQMSCATATSENPFAKFYAAPKP